MIKKTVEMKDTLFGWLNRVSAIFREKFGGFGGLTS